jgi:ribonuclease J
MVVNTTNVNVHPLRIMPLGGVGEIGKNTWAFEYEDEILLLDGGLSFPTEDMHGVNIVLPDMTWVREHQERLVGMVVTHGHEDHIGGIPYHLQRINIPRIIIPRLARALLEGKLQETGLLGRTELVTAHPRDVFRVGKHFEVEYIQNTHSIADSYTLAIRTPVGLVIHSGDFKFDHTPVDGRKFDYHRLAEYGEEGVLCLISDSTNAELPGFTPSEMSVFPNLDREVAKAKGRVIITTFASSVHRVNMILQIAQKQGRVVTALGRSMLNVLSHAKKLGFIDYPENLLVPMNAIRQLPDEKVLILTTGSQGEPLAALSRIARNEHQQLRIREGDTVIFSANPIPGNTISVVRTIDSLIKLGANVIYGKDKGIHVSGHGATEDHKLMIALTKPKFFFPAHGEHRMLLRHADTAVAMGVPRENMVITDNGDVVELRPDSICIKGTIPSGIELLDNSRSGMVSDHTLKERQRIATEGVISVAIALDSRGEILARPEIVIKAMAQTQGSSGRSDTAPLEEQIRSKVVQVIKERWNEFVYTDAALNTVMSQSNREDRYVDWEGLKARLEKVVIQATRDQVSGRPMVLVLLQVCESLSRAAKPNSATFLPVETVETTNVENVEIESGRRRKRSSTTATAVLVKDPIS